MGGERVSQADSNLTKERESAIIGRVFEVYREKEEAMIARFREEVYQNFTRRQDAGVDLLDALTSAEQVESAVAMSESPLFRREFGSIYDTLNQGKMDKSGLQETLA